MDLLSLLRTLGALGTVLGLLAGALWLVRRYDIKLPGRVSGGSRKRVEMVERLSIDAKRSVALIRRDDAEHLILIAPDGHVVIETGIAKPAVAEPVAAVVAAPVPVTPINDNLSELRQGFGQLVEQARTRLTASARG
ncbi:flagellar biosynthetic protein FliO [Sphingosinithalassobacter sp. CS137]|uniref:flagellar biosynthetic protein FliO n=1 Tax=Sphingosinithalassobacter sp. CS137 TaxID=2762748 RepID=UPI00165DE5BE|nr:flagellar biosynthetic protein FliO [Sphingosinithalassobacter sp. CS137]